MYVKEDINTDRIIELQDRLCKAGIRYITTEDLVYVLELPEDYVNEQIDKSLEVLKNTNNNFSRYITKSKNNYKLMPIGTHMLYLAATQLDDGTSKFEKFVNVILLLIQVQMFVDEFVISMFYKEDIYNFAN